MLTSACKRTTAHSDDSSEYINVLMTKCDVVDYMFNDFPASINQREPMGVAQTLSYISDETGPPVTPNCKPAARMIYYGQGELLLEADLYFEGGCEVFVFIKDEKALFSRKLTQDGVSFHQNLVQQFR